MGKTIIMHTRIKSNLYVIIKKHEFVIAYKLIRRYTRGMKQSSKGIIAFMGLMLIYILLAPLGFYNTVGIILFPIISIPLAICLIKNQLVVGVDFLFNSVIIIGIYLLTHNNMQCVLVYVISVCVPAYVVTILYKKEVPLPNIIMYHSIIFASYSFYVFSYYETDWQWIMKQNSFYSWTKLKEYI